MPFLHRETVRFGHVDAAGIVFYPRYFEMLNAAVEAWFEEALGRPFAHLHLEQGLGTPLVDCTARFTKASRLGDRLDLALTVADLGRRTFDLDIRVTCTGEPRMEARLRHIFVHLNPLGAADIPEDLREAMGAFR